MQATSKALFFSAALLIFAGSYSSFYNSILSTSMLTVEHIIVHLEIILSVVLVIAVLRDSRLVSHFSILLIAVLALDFLLNDVNDMPVQILLGVGPRYLKVVAAKSVSEIIDRYDAIVWSATALIAALTIKNLKKSHN